jgi:Ca2+/Na+ antiporter
MLGLALAAVVVVGLAVGAMNDMKGLAKMLCLVVVLAVICFVVYKLVPGSPAQGLLEQPDKSELKLTDTILSLTYITGAIAVLAIVVGEIRLAITNRKG